MIKESINDNNIYDITKRLRDLQTLYGLYQITSSTLNLNELLNLIMEMTLNTIGAEVGLIMLKQKEGEGEYAKVTFGLTKEIVNDIKYNEKMSLIAWLNKRTGPVIIRDINKDKRFIFPANARIFLNSILYAPIKIRNKRVGAIILGNKSLATGVTNFTQDDLNIIQNISGQISVAIENAMLYEEVVDIKNYNLGIINSINIGVITTSLDKKINTFNKGAEFIFNIPGDKIIGKSVIKLLKNIDKDKRATILDALERNENLLSFEAELRLSDGDIKILSFSIANLKGTGDNIVGYVISIDDISEKKILENQILRAEQLAAIGELSAGIAHEIKNPLTSIKGFTQLLNAKIDNKEFLKKYVGIMNREVERLNSIIENLLQFAKPKVKKFDKFNIFEILKRSIELLKFQLKKSNINLVMNENENIEIYGDYHQIEQVFINVILNAIQAMPRGGKLEIKSRVLIKKSPNNLFFEYVALYFSDTGIGIEQKNIDKLFNPFFTTKPKGTGLGLSIAHRIITEHKGMIEVISEKGKGTTFIIYFPTINNF